MNQDRDSKQTFIYVQSHKELFNMAIQNTGNTILHQAFTEIQQVSRFRASHFQIRQNLQLK